MRVEVHEPGSDDEAVAVQDRRAGRRALPDGGDPPVLEEEVRDRVGVGGGIHDAAPAEEQSLRHPSSPPRPRRA